jgi:hypothetical protein
MHATALSFPGATYHRPADLHPPRLDIALPRALGSRLAADAAASVRGGGNHSYFYSCINCERGEATLTLNPDRNPHPNRDPDPNRNPNPYPNPNPNLNPNPSPNPREARPRAVSTARASTARRSSRRRARAARRASTTTARRWPRSAACTPTRRGTSSSVGGAPRWSGT